MPADMNSTEARENTNNTGFSNSDSGGILSIDKFKTIVNHERIRCDRFNCTFSIIILKFIIKDVTIIDGFMRDILQSIRTIDRIGRNNEGDIIILLPDTDNTGAQIFCQKCKHIFGQFHYYIKINIYSYPDNWVSNYIENSTASNSLPRDIKASIESIFIKKMPLWKRITDIVLSSLMIITLSPLFLLISLFITVISPGPIFFKQDRIGFKGIPFHFYKFRTMKVGNNQEYHGKYSQNFINNGSIPMKKLDGQDPRIITGGRLIRISCMDELPQLWNVLKGDMSLVGPRPCILYEAEEYLHWHTHRFDTMPGLTGLWQVSGKNKLSFKQMIRLDIAYCNKISFLRDIWIILKTPFAILGMMANSIICKFRNEEENDPGSSMERVLSEQNSSVNKM